MSNNFPYYKEIGKMGVGRPAHQPTDENRQKIMEFSMFGYTQAEIAKFFDIDIKTLYRHYRSELDQAAMEATRKVAKGLYRKAIEDDDLQAQIFWLKTRGRWRTVDAEITANHNLLQDLDSRKESIKEAEKDY